MRIGQTSITVFISRFFASALGFLSTLYFAQRLGAEIIGIFSLLMTTVSWLFLIGNMGITTAMKKRISEGENQGEFLSAAILWVGFSLVILSIGVALFQPIFENYISEFDKYVDYPLIWFLIPILFIQTFIKIVNRILIGQRMVHIRGLLDPVNTGAQSFFQVIFVLIGCGLLGMLIGWALGGLLVGFIGLYWVRIRPAPPTIKNLKSLYDYAKFSWLSGLKARVFNQVDILLLGVFVSSSLVGVYSVAWSIAKFIELFGNSISKTMFPEISNISAQDPNETAAGLVEDSLAYNGLIAIPGFVGGLILADRLMRLYGPEFTQGATVLALLILATLVYSYLSQLLNTLNAMDRPDLAFRINIVFIALNAVLNVIFIWQYGTKGAAAATVLSAVAGLGIAYYALKDVLDFRVPAREPVRQVGAAIVMGVFVWISLRGIETTGFVKNNAIIVVGLVSSGATVYFFTLLTISPEFRATVNRNLPVNIPYLN